MTASGAKRGTTNGCCAKHCCPRKARPCLVVASSNRIQAEAPACLGLVQVGSKDPLRMGPCQTAPTTNAAWEDPTKDKVSSQMLKGEVQVLIFLQRSTDWTLVDFHSMKASKLYSSHSRLTLVHPCEVTLGLKARSAVLSSDMKLHLPEWPRVPTDKSREKHWAFLKTSSWISQCLNV